MAKKERLDIVLVNKGLTSSREQAQKRIMAGEVLVDNEKIDKSGTKVDPNAEIRFLGSTNPYASRGGLKLAHALAVFPISLEGKIVCDLGASTGGFVDCALQHGAAKVYAVDVGYGQLAWSLRTDDRVINMEKTNARYLQGSDFSQLPEWVTTDVSFISLEKIFPAVERILAPEGQMLALIKPQFEAGRDFVGKNGVVRNPDVHCAVLERVIKTAEDLNFVSCGVIPSPIRGPKGNIEYLYWLARHEQEKTSLIDIEACVREGFLLP